MHQHRPLIGLTTYRKQASAQPLIEVDGLMPTYTTAVLQAGGLPVMIPLTLSEADLQDLFAILDGIILPGGGDIAPERYGGDPNNKIYGVDETRDRIEFWLAREAVRREKPVLGVCRGHQVLNVALGGTLWEDVFDLMPDALMHAYFRGYARDMLTHTVEICPDSHLARLMGAQEAKPVNSIHHQGVRELAAELRATAYAPDGLIEGIEVPGHPFAVGVQWHPEEFTHRDDEMLALFKGLVEACAAGRGSLFFRK